MNLIKQIVLRNIKGKANMTLEFDDMHANHPNILVAPNGFGKSTIAVAFEALHGNKMHLKEADAYQGDLHNIPSLSIELIGENANTFNATDQTNTISQNISTYVINSPLYARNTSKTMNGYHTSSAELGIESLVIVKSVPVRQSIQYQVTEERGKYGDKGKLFSNIADALQNINNLQLLLSAKSIIQKCSIQAKPQQLITDFLGCCGAQGSTDVIKSNISKQSIQNFCANAHLNALYEISKQLVDLPYAQNDIDAVFTTIQLIDVFHDQIEKLKACVEFLEYSLYRQKIDEKLRCLNTTGRNVRSVEDHGKLVVNFGLANTVSNGERDVLSFVVNLAIFEAQYKKKIGILVIDEVFDYLDGSNILAIQYYLSQMIERCRANDKILFPLIMTHLDPEVFCNYYFRKPKVHYLASAARFNLQSDIIKMLRIRENDDPAFIGVKEDIEKYFIHYHSAEFSMCQPNKDLISPTFIGNSFTFRENVYADAFSYLQSRPYDPIKVACAVRIKIEEKLFTCLDIADQTEYLILHTTIKKLNYVDDKGHNIPEVFYLLQPLYNDGLHLRGDDRTVNNRIKSVCLKLDTEIVRSLVRLVFS